MRRARVWMRLIALAVGVVLVVGSVVAVVRSNVEHDAGHGIGMRLVRLFRPIAAPSPISFSRSFPTWIATAWAVDGVVRVRWLGDFTGIDFARSDPIRWECIYVECARHGTGIWGGTGERELLGVLLHLEGMPTSPSLDLSPAEREEAIRILNDELKNRPHPAVPHFWVDASLLSTGVTERSRVLWSGYAINAATIVGLGMMGWGLFGAFVAVRERRRIGKHQCAKCRYDLRGLGEARCPECGAMIVRE